ncbi:hypothetical protein BGW38_010212 [Lunasporangiospora selenospora]|uniref:Uncharacterized protein n=1 Tax=Lunasporangiospora selenospora TaxID=979761 RepID=A0A9P6FWP7_9FUNG|nr:hypothetical protein BGW38_010212 [Lunasporangiospora selenospora]
MPGPSRYNGPGANLRSQPRAPRPSARARESAHSNANSDLTTSPVERQRPAIDTKPDLSGTTRDHAAALISPQRYAPNHQRQWSDASSLMSGSPAHHAPPPHGSQYSGYSSGQDYGYNGQYQQHQGAYGPGHHAQQTGSPASPPTAPSPASSSPYFHAADQRQPYGGSSGYQQRQQAPSSSSGRTNTYGSRGGQNGYGNYDQSPMLSPASNDSWRSPPGPRPYERTQYRQHAGQQPYSAASSSREALNYSSSITSNSSSVMQARQERNERNLARQKSSQQQAEEWLTSPTGTELETEVLSWSDDEAIVTRAVRSPPTGYMNEKTLPAIPAHHPTLHQTPTVRQLNSNNNNSNDSAGRDYPGRRQRSDSDMIKVEVGEATTVVPTDHGAGANFVKNIPSSPPISATPKTPPPPSQPPQPPVHRFNHAPVSGQTAPVPSTPTRATAGRRMSSDWDGGKRISLEDMLSSPPTVSADAARRQQAMDSWRSSPPLKGAATSGSATFTELKNKRRSSLPDKIVPNWNENTQNWRSSIGQRRPSWMASMYSTGDKDKDPDLSFLQKFSKKGQEKDKKMSNGAAAAKDDSDRSRRRSRSCRDSYASSITRSSRSRSGSRSRDRRSYRSHSMSSRFKSRSRSRSSTRSRSQSPHSRSVSRSRSKSLTRARQGSVASKKSNYRTQSRASFRSKSRSRSRSSSRSRSRSRSPLSRNASHRYRADGKEDPVRDSNRYSWQSGADTPQDRHSWDSVPPSASTAARKPSIAVPRYSIEIEEEVMSYESPMTPKNPAAGPPPTSNGPPGSRGMPNGTTPVSPPFPRSARDDIDSDDSDSPPLKVQYSRHAGMDSDGHDLDDDTRSVTSSKYPASIISNFALPPATSPTTPNHPHYVPPLPNSIAPGGANSLSSQDPYSRDYKPMAPPPVPTSPPPPMAGSGASTMLTSVTTVSIEATTATLSSSRVSVDSFKNVPGTTGIKSREYEDTDFETDFDTDVESSSTGLRRGPSGGARAPPVPRPPRDSTGSDLPAIQPSYVSMTSVVGSGNDMTTKEMSPPSSTSSGPATTIMTSITPVSSSSIMTVNTSGQLKRNESTASSVSVASARSTRSYVSSTSSILSSSPQRAPPPIPISIEGMGPAGGIDSPSPTSAMGVTTGSGLFGPTKRSGSSGSARGVRSGLNKQIMPPSGPPPERPVPPPIPSSPSTSTPAAMSAARAAPPAPTASGAIQMQILADEGQSRSQFGAVSVETDEVELTRLNNRVTQLERELEFAQQDLEIGAEEATELQSRVRELETELDELHAEVKTSKTKADAATVVPAGQILVSESQMTALKELQMAKEKWEDERERLLEQSEQDRVEHQEALKQSVERQQTDHAHALDKIQSSHAEVLEKKTHEAEQGLKQLREDHAFELEDCQQRLEAEYRKEKDDLLDQIEDLKDEKQRVLDDLQKDHEMALEGLREEQSKVLESLQAEQVVKSKEEARVWEEKLAEKLGEMEAKSAQDLEALKGSLRQEMEQLETKVAESEGLLKATQEERDQAVKDLGLHKKEMDSALDRLEAVLTENKSAHALLVQGLETKVKESDERAKTLESEVQELTQDNEQIVEEMQRREEAWTQERTMLVRSATGEESEAGARLQEMQEQLVALTESKRQADSQFQGIVKGLLREATTNKKDVESARGLIEEERKAKEEALQLIDTIKLEREQGEAGLKADLEKSRKEMMAQFDAQMEGLKRNGNEAMLVVQKELEQRLHHQKQELDEERTKSRELEASLEQELDEERTKSRELEATLEQELEAARTKSQQLEASLEQELEAERTKSRQLEASLDQEIEAERIKSRQLEASLGQELEAERIKSRQLEATLGQELEAERTKSRQLEATLDQEIEAERIKSRELEASLEQDRAKAGQSLQQEQFTWKTRLDQTEAALKTKEAQVRKLEQEADATIKIQTDLLQSMERDTANTQRKIESQWTAKMEQLEASFEEERQRFQQQLQQQVQQAQQQVQQEMGKKYEQEANEKETQLQQQLDSIYQQEMAMAKQELINSHEQQMKGMRQQHEQALQRSGQSFEMQSRSMQDQTRSLQDQSRLLQDQLQGMQEQLEKATQQVDQERSEKEVAVKDRTFLERRMAGHDRRAKELEATLESAQKELDQTRAKSGQDLQDIERSKMSLERKLTMAREDVEELNRIRDELEGDRDELRKEVQRLKKSGGGGSSRSSRSGDAPSAAWEAEKKMMQEQVRKLEDEVQIMLEKNMNLTIELSMK